MVDNETYIWNALKAAGYRDIEVAGIMGNLMYESGLKPNNLQNTFNKKFGLTDDEYTAKVNSGEISVTEFYSDHAGYGLAQWTYYTRKKSLYAKCFPDIGSLEKQTSYLVAELAGFPTVQKKLPECKTIKQCSDVIMTFYEMPSDQNTSASNSRAYYGQQIYERHHTEPKLQSWYACQVAAYLTLSACENDFARLKGDYHIYNVGTWYKIALGQYATQAEAEKHLAEARKINGGAFINKYQSSQLIR